jgi:hypothetical protein
LAALSEADAYFGGELSGGKSGRGSENKVPFVAAVSLDEAGHPLYIKMAMVQGFTRKAIADWAEHNLSPGCTVISDGLACFFGVTDIGCQHETLVEGGRKPKDIPAFSWVNTIIGTKKPVLAELIMLSNLLNMAQLLGGICLPFQPML